MPQRRHAQVGRLLLLSGAVGLAACESELANIPDNELQDKVYECDRTADQSPGFAIRCDNYRRECRNRREKGRFVC